MSNQKRHNWEHGLPKRVCGIYQIRNTISGRLYVGSSQCIRHRWVCHRAELNKGQHLNKHLQAAWGKYGEGAFVFEILEILDSQEWLIVVEQAWIDFLGAYREGYNAVPIAGRTAGRKDTPELLAAKRQRGRQKAKSFIITFPNGKEETTENLNDFCREHGLASTQMRFCARGKCRSSKGFSCRSMTMSKVEWEALVLSSETEREKTRPHTNRYPRRQYVLTYPDGREEVFTNVSEKARELQVATGSLHALVNGRALRIKGCAIRPLGVSQQEHDAAAKFNIPNYRGKYVLIRPDGIREEFENLSSKARELGLSPNTLKYALRSKSGVVKGMEIRLEKT